MERRRYLRRMPLEQALEAWLGLLAEIPPLGAEEVAAPEALGRVTAEPSFARRSVPHFHCAAMDGIALGAQVTFGASETRPRVVAPDAFTVVDTGDPIPPDADTVVMIEDVQWREGGAVELIAPATPWQHVRLAGEDVVASELVLPAAQRVRPADVAALLACGVTRLPVVRRPRVAILPTGDELVDPLEADEAGPARGAIPETNSYLIAGLTAEWGGEPLRRQPVPDDPDRIRAALLEAVAEADVVALNAGSSAGRDDYVPRLIEEEGRLLAHGIDVMPGKPAALGLVRGIPVLAVPGYPVSAWVICDRLLRPLLERMQGLPVSVRTAVTAIMARSSPSRAGTEEILRVRAARVGGRLTALPLPRGASLLSSVVRADGVVCIPAESEGVAAGEEVRLELLRPIQEVEAQLLAVGSHDLLLDLISQHLRRRLPGSGLAGVHVGSLAGLHALRRGECHLAGTHLMDEETGEYNRSWVRRLFPEGGVALVRLARRTQGLIVPRGNPLGLSGLADVAAQNALFLNRQRGSGTRLLLDWELRRLAIDPERIRGYHREVYTHLAVAEAVRSGGADAGLGVLAAARALGLDFIPVADEEYDLAIREDALHLPVVRTLLDVLADPAFRAEVDALGGYDCREAGQRRSLEG